MDKLKVGDRFKTVFTELEVIEDETENETAKCRVLKTLWPEYANVGDIVDGSAKWIGRRGMEKIKLQRK